MDKNWQSGYISEVLSYEPNLRLTTSEADFLLRIAQSKMSSYKIWSDLSYLKRLPLEEVEQRNNRMITRVDIRSTGEDMAYKNVNRNLQNLLKKQLIVEVKSKRFSGVHGAKYYKITSRGIFYLIRFMPLYLPIERLIRYRNDVILRTLLYLPIERLIRYRNDVILRTLLFPYFEEKTFKIFTTRFMLILVHYLSECCDLTLAAVNDIRKENDEFKKEKRTRLLIAQLRWAAKLMALRFLGIDDTIDELSHGQHQEFLDPYIAGDKNLVRLVNEVKAEIDQGYGLFASEVTKRTK